MAIGEVHPKSSGLRVGVLGPGWPLHVEVVMETPLDALRVMVGQE